MVQNPTTGLNLATEEWVNRRKNLLGARLNCLTEDVSNLYIYTYT